MFSTGQPQSFTVSVRPANNFPADIYFLVDKSFSMNDDLENLRNLSSQLGMNMHFVKHFISKHTTLVSIAILTFTNTVLRTWFATSTLNYC